MAKYTQEVLLQMDLFKYPFDISSCVSNRHLKLNMPQSNSRSSLQTLLFLQSSFQYMATPLHCLGLLYFCHDLQPIHLSMILMGIYFQNIFKNVLNAPTLLTLWSKPNSSISSHWDKCQSLLLLLFFFNPFTSQQPE